MPTKPEDVVNRAFDECGVPPIGDLFEGTVRAMAALRIYDPTLRQVFAAAHWNFARKQDYMTLIGDVNGVYHTNTRVPSPWSYMYEWPVDCVHARFVPRRDVPALDTSTLLPSSETAAWNSPTPFLVGSYPRPNPVNSTWDQVEGHDPEQTRVILTNQLGAQLVYTGVMQYPDAWDPLFEQAVVAILAARLALPCMEDKKLAVQLRRDNIEIARAALAAARVRDGNEGWTVADHTPDWIRARVAGAAYTSLGILYNSWSTIPFVEDAGGVY